MEHHLRVALLATAVEFGGIDRVLANLVRGMDADVELLPILYTRRDTVKHRLFDILAELDVRFDKIYVDASRRRYPTPLRDLLHTLASVRGRRVDLIHSHGYRADVFGVVAAKMLGLPIVSTCHGYVATDRRLGLYNRLDLVALRRFDRVIAVSDQLRTELIGHGVDPRRVQTVVNAIGDDRRPDRDRLRIEVRLRHGIASHEILFGFVGRLGQEKGLAYLVDALASLGDGRIKLLLVGDGPQRTSLQDAVLRAGVGDKVLFVGFQDDPGGWYPAMDIFVLPSLTEGTPMVLLEAMSSGLPVIATAVGGMPSIVTDLDNGLLIPPADATRLARAMSALATDHGLRCALAGRARVSVLEKFDVRAWIHTMRDVYESTVAEKQSNREPPGGRTPAD